MHMFLYFFILNFMYIAVKKFIHSLAIIRKKKKLVQKNFIQYILSLFINCFSKNVLIISKVSYCFSLSKKNVLRKCILCQKDSSVPLLDTSRIRNNTVCGYVNRKNNIKEFQRSGFRFVLKSLYT